MYRYFDKKPGFVVAVATWKWEQFQEENKKRRPSMNFEGMAAAEIFGFYSPEDIEKVVNEKTILIVPESMSEEAGELTDLVDMITTVEPDTHRDIKGLSIDAVPAYNNKKAFHPKSENWVGYILDVDGVRVYIAGDTDMTDDNRKVTCDVAMVPIGGTYTMDAGEAAALINEIKPKIAIPTHYGAVVGSEGDAETFKSLVEDSVVVEVKKQY